MFETLESRRLLTGTVELFPGAAAAQSILSAQNGTTFLLHAGTYPAFDVDNSGITLKLFGDGAVFVTTPRTSGNDFALYLEPTADDFTATGIDFSGAYYYTLKGETTRSYSNTNGSYDGATGATFIACKFHDSGTHVIKISPDCDRWTFRDCEIYNSGRRDANQGQGVDAVNIDDLLFTGNYIHDCTQNGIFVKGGSQRCVIENNRIVGGWSGILLGQDTDAGAFDTRQNPLRYESLDCVARGNTIINPAYSGIGMGSALNPIVVNNVIRNSSQTGQAGFYFFTNSAGKKGKGGTVTGNVIWAKTYISTQPAGAWEGGIPDTSQNIFTHTAPPLKPAKVTIDDYLKIDRVIGLDSSGPWWQGDLNLDGLVNIDDYLVLTA